MGFAFVASGPLVRSSYKAAEVFVRAVLEPGDPDAADALLRDRIEQAKAKSTSELAARDAASLVTAASLVRRAAP
jgi:lipoyl synthase